MSFLEKEYPTISNMYFDYINGEEYNSLAITKHTDQTTSKAAAEIKTLYSQSNIQAETTKRLTKRLNDITTEIGVECEKAGFILGFSYALKLMSEAKSVLEVVK